MVRELQDKDAVAGKLLKQLYMEQDENG